MNHKRSEVLKSENLGLNKPTTYFLFNLIFSNLMDKNGKKGLKRTRFQKEEFYTQKRSA